MARLRRGHREKSEVRRVVHGRELRIEVPRREDAEPANRRSVSTTERSEIRRVVRRREIRIEVPRGDDAEPAIRESVLLVGHDWGAIMAWYLCLFRPNKVKALVNFECAFYTTQSSQKNIKHLRSTYGDATKLIEFRSLKQ